jgi:hypothetical protein
MADEHNEGRPGVNFYLTLARLVPDNHFGRERFVLRIAAFSSALTLTNVLRLPHMQRLIGRNDTVRCKLVRRENNPNENNLVVEVPNAVTMRRIITSNYNDLYNENLLIERILSLDFENLVAVEEM